MVVLPSPLHQSSTPNSPIFAKPSTVATAIALKKSTRLLKPNQMPDPVAYFAKFNFDSSMSIVSSDAVFSSSEEEIEESYEEEEIVYEKVKVLRPKQQMK